MICWSPIQYLNCQTETGIPDASPMQTLASYRLCHGAENRKTECESDNDYLWVDCWTDHRLFVSRLNLRIQPARRPQGKKAPRKLDVSKLSHDSMRQAFINDISNQLGAINHSSEDPEENWTVFQKVFILQLQLP